MRLLLWSWVLAISAAGCATRDERSTSQTQPTATNQLAAPRTVQPARPPAGTQQLFDGKTLNGWRISDFAGSGPVKVQDGKLVLEMGTMTGVTYTNPVPTMNYEISLEAMKLEGSDFFCGLTFPVGKTACTFIVGGWGGMVVGLSSIDHSDASENETTQGIEFAMNRWYRIRVLVTDEKIEAWIDDEQKVDVEIKGRIIGIRPGDIQNSLPLGIASYMTKAAIRDIRMRRL